MSEITIKLAETKAEFKGALTVRERVFVQEQQIPAEVELDEDDEIAIHAVALHQGRVVGTGRLVIENDSWARIGRMAVDEKFRRQGTGARVLVFLEDAARAQGSYRSVLHAQEYIKSFYARRGYWEHGAAFLEVGIPHIEMHKRL